MTGAPLLYLEDDPAAAIARAAKVLSAPDGVVMFPTDTVYGLLAALDAEAGYRRIFALKQRPPEQPLQVLTLAGTRLAQDARAALAPWPEHLAQFVAGQATVVLDAECFTALPPAIPRLQPGTVGVRLPAYAPLQELLALLPHQAVWATSANLSGEPVATSAVELEHKAAGWLAGTVLAVTSRYRLPGQASMVVRIIGGECQLLRT